MVLELTFFQVGFSATNEPLWLLTSIYQAPTVEQAERNLEDFATKWDASHPTITTSWCNKW
jgi:transposase-like protein